MTQQQGQAGSSLAATINRRRAIWLWLLIGVCTIEIGMGLACMYRFSGNIDSRPDQWHVVSVTVLDPAVMGVIKSAPYGVGVIGLLGIYAFFRGRWGAGTAATIATLLLCIAWHHVSYVTAFSVSWVRTGECVGSDGKQYALLRYRPMLSQDIALGREKSRNVFRTVYDVVGNVFINEMSSFRPVPVAVVRPANCQGKDGRLLLSPDGWIIGLPEGNDCYFAYELASGRFLSGHELARISPLILIGPNTEPLEADVRSILAGPGWRLTGIRAEAARHPNAKIRELFMAMPATRPPSASEPGTQGLRYDFAPSGLGWT